MALDVLLSAMLAFQHFPVTSAATFSRYKRSGAISQMYVRLSELLHNPIRWPGINVK